MSFVSCTLSTSKRDGTEDLMEENDAKCLRLKKEKVIYFRDRDKLYAVDRKTRQVFAAGNETKLVARMPPSSNC